MDVAKCFDKMNYTETANDLYEAGVVDDQFVTVANSNKKCQVAVKIPGGSQTKRIEMNEIEMQGTVLAPLKCSVQIDTLGKECLKNNEGIYKYKGCTSIPPLSYIDDILGITKCSTDSVKLNALIQSKMNHKKLQLSQTKCYKMHVGKPSGCCPTLKVDGKEMKSVIKETYLGEILTSYGGIAENIQERCKKGIGIVNKIIAILNEVSFGHFYFEMAFLFRQSMLINSMLCNVEVLYGLNKSQIEALESVDRIFLRRVFQSPISTPTESFYIETNFISLRYIIMGRRLMYYHTLLQKSNEELVKTVFQTQQKFATKNDWIITLRSNLDQCNFLLSESEIKLMKKHKFKRLVSAKMKQLSDEYMITLQQSHTKSNRISITENIKQYLISDQLSLEEKRLLFQIRNRTCDLKTNYRQLYSNNMLCRLCAKQEESEIHLMMCDEVVDDQLKIEIKNIDVSDVWKSFAKQKSAIIILNKLFKIRNLKYEKKKLSNRTQENPTIASSSYAM